MQINSYVRSRRTGGCKYRNDCGTRDCSDVGNELQVLNAILYVAEHGCKWRRLPPRFGNWHTIYMRMNRWSKSGVLDRVFEQLQRQRIVRLKLEAVSLDSTIVKVHPDGTGALKKTDPSRSADLGTAGPPSFIWLPRMPGRP